MKRALWFSLAWLCTLACEDPEPVLPTPEELARLMDPQTCGECHPNHLSEWAGSMHAYASEDPVFLAMNAKGQRETGGALGSFCVQCHAPIALKTGATTDGLNLADVPASLKGVSCYACHAVSAVEGTHNNALVLSDDGVMRGGFADAAENPVHRSSYSNLHDRDHLASADMCGSCHDIVNPLGVHIEQTYKEWKESLFSDPTNRDRSTCNRCHMPGRTDVVANYEGVSLRRHHDHSMPGVDIALTPFPDRERQRQAVQLSLDTTLSARLCVGSDGENTRLLVQMENMGAGHAWPSGAIQDRRAWVEIIGYEGDEERFSTGNVADDQAMTSVKNEDTQMISFGATAYDADGNITHDFWDMVRTESDVMPSPVPHLRGIDTGENHRNYNLSFPGDVDRVEMKVRIRPMGLDILQELVDHEGLDPAVKQAMPTFDLGSTELVWTPEAADQSGCVPPLSR